MAYASPSRGSHRPAAAARIRSRPKRIWIDLDNSPHVPFFAPIMACLRALHYDYTITVRDCFQVCGLADLLGLEYERVGRHYGKRAALKVAGMGIRTAQLLASVGPSRPALALSHGSRSQLLAAKILGIPTILIQDYEYAEFPRLLRPTWVMTPEIIPQSSLCCPAQSVLQYPGIKEDVYVPSFIPNANILRELDIEQRQVVATARPPADEAHYYRPESDALFSAAIAKLRDANVKIVVLPRNERQAEKIRSMWPQLLSNKQMVIPAKTIDGLNLIWHSDLVVSGGGTMNREAAALAVPVYSVFRGAIGAVDRYLAESGRLTLLESADDVQTKLDVRPRNRPARPIVHDDGPLSTIVKNIVKVVEAL